MPKLKMTEKQRFEADTNNISALLDYAFKFRFGNIKSAASALGVCEGTLYMKLSSPENIRIKDLRKYVKFVPESIKDELRKLIIP